MCTIRLPGHARSLSSNKSARHSETLWKEHMTPCVQFVDYTDSLLISTNSRRGWSNHINTNWLYHDKHKSVRKLFQNGELKGPVVFFCRLSEKIFKIFSDFENLKKYSTIFFKIFSVLKILKKYSTENVFGNPEKWSKFPYFDAKTSKFSRLRRATS